MSIKEKIISVLQKISQTYHPQRKWRLPSVAYTLLHKNAFLKQEKYIFGKNSPAGILHDCEKLFLYFIPKLRDDQIQKMHQKIQPHHANSPYQTRVEHLLELYIDWASSALTKPDKPLNPFATLLYFYPNRLYRILPVLLAVNPKIISPTIQDMDEARKNNDCYFLKNPTQHLKLYAQTKEIIMQIDHRLSHINLNQFNPDYLPETLSEMAPIDIFLKTTWLLAQKRRQNVNIQEMRQQIKKISKEFQAANCFQCTPPIAPKNIHYTGLMPHPFLIDNYRR